MIARARESVAAFVNARGADEIAFGLNATSFIRSISLAVGQTLGARGPRSSSAISITSRTSRPGSPSSAPAPASSGGTPGGRGRRATAPGGSRAAADASARGSWPAPWRRTPPAACVDVAEVARRAHAVGAEVFLDAVHYCAASPDRRAGVRLRLPRLLGIQGVRAAHGLRLVPRARRSTACRRFVRTSSPM